MLCSVDTEAAETDGHEVDKVCGDAVLDVRLFSVQVGEADEPAFSDDLAVGP